MIEENMVSLKKDELDKMVSELKSHYAYNEFFVDPEKKFPKLLDKVIKFFEGDDFIIHIKQNEQLYINFKQKYEDAINLIKYYEINSQVKMNVDKETNEESSYISSLETNYSSNYNTSSKIQQELSNVYDSNFSKNISIQDNDEKRISYSKYEKLKNDYYEIFEEKKNLEIRLQDYESLKASYEELLKENLISCEKVKNLNDSNSSITNEISLLKERFKTMSSENSDLLTYIKNLKENLCKNEKEKAAFKQKATILNSKLKLHEERTDSLKKKCFELSNQLKNLKEKYENEKFDNIQLHKQISDLKSDLENTIYKYEKEKPMLVKEALFSEENSLEFKYNKQTNFIEIFVENIKIAEYENKLTENSNNLNKKKRLTPVKLTPIQECANKQSEKNSNKNSIVKNFSINDNKENESISLNKLFSTPSKKNSPNAVNNNQLLLEKINEITDFNYDDDEKNDLNNTEKGRKIDINNRSKYNSSSLKFKNILTTHRSRHKKIISLEEDFDENDILDNHGKYNKVLVLSNQKNQILKGNDSDIDEFPLKLTFSENINKFESKILKVCHVSIENPASFQLNCLKNEAEKGFICEKLDYFSLSKEGCLGFIKKESFKIDNIINIGISCVSFSSFKNYYITQSSFNIMSRKVLIDDNTNLDFKNYKPCNHPLNNKTLSSIKKEDSNDQSFQPYERTSYVGINRSQPNTTLNSSPNKSDNNPKGTCINCLVF